MFSLLLYMPQDLFVVTGCKTCFSIIINMRDLRCSQRYWWRLKSLNKTWSAFRRTELPLLTGSRVKTTRSFFAKYSPHKKKGRQRTLNVKWGAFIWPVLPCKSNTYYIFWVCICSLNYPTCKAHVPCYIVTCGLSGSCTCSVVQKLVAWK